MRRVRLITACAALLSATACVNYTANAASFCRAISDVVDPARDHEKLNGDQARTTADDFAVAMRDAEDATRDVRRVARRVSVAYDELAAILDDDDTTGEEVAELRVDLQDAREDLRSACAQI